MLATCEQCGERFEAQLDTARLCGPRCRKRASRAAQNGTGLAKVTSFPTAAPEGEAGLEWPLVTATRRELDEAGVLDTVAGHLALELAAQVCASRDTGSAKAAASKEFRAVMAEALKNVTTQADSLDELASRRLKRASGA